MSITGVSGIQAAGAAATNNLVAAADASSADSTSSTAAKTETSGVLGQDTFLKLLVTQLRNQNPLEPMKDTEFIAQMAQFSALEQMNQVKEEIQGLREDLSAGLKEINETLSGLSGGSKAEADKLEAAVEAVNLLGKQVRAQLDDRVVEGIVESVKNLAASPTLLVAGRELGLSSILEVLS